LIKIKLAVIAAVIMMFLPLAALADAQGKPVVKKVLANGMTALFQESSAEPASVCLFVKVGPAREANENYGITRLLNSVLLSIDPLGNPNSPTMRIEQAGALISAETSADYTCFRLTVPSRNLPDALKALGDVFNGRGFTDFSVSREKEAMVSYRLRAEDRFEDRVFRTYLENTMEGSRYLCITEGKPGIVSGLGAKQLYAWYVANYQPGNMALSVCGKLNAASVFNLAEASFKGAGAGRQSSGRLTTMPAASEGSVEVESPPGFSAVLVGYEAPSLGSQDYAAASVAESLLACGMGSSMFRKLRDDSVSAYGFGSWMPAISGPSRLALYAVTDEGGGESVRAMLKACVDELKAGTFGNDDLGRAKSVVLGRNSARKESNLGKAWMAGLYETMGLGQEYGANFEKQVGKLDRDELARMSGRYFDRRYQVVLRPRKNPY
jgi:predicted Zn-dependent peptidase